MIKHLLNQVCTLQRATNSTNAMGETVKTYAPVTTFAGQIRPQNGKESRLDGKKTQTANFRCYCEPITVKPRDRIVCDGITYEVVFAYDVMSLGRLMQIDLDVIT